MPTNYESLSPISSANCPSRCRSSLPRGGSIRPPPLGSMLQVPGTSPTRDCPLRAAKKSRRSPAFIPRARTVVRQRAPRNLPSPCTESHISAESTAHLATQSCLPVCDARLDHSGDAFMSCGAQDSLRSRRRPFDDVLLVADSKPDPQRILLRLLPKDSRKFGGRLGSTHHSTSRTR